jgi:hypothetical protein
VEHSGSGTLRRPMDQPSLKEGTENLPAGKSMSPDGRDPASAVDVATAFLYFTQDHGYPAHVAGKAYEC